MIVPLRSSLAALLLVGLGGSPIAAEHAKGINVRVTGEGITGKSQYSQVIVDFRPASNRRLDGAAEQSSSSTWMAFEGSTISESTTPDSGSSSQWEAAQESSSSSPAVIGVAAAAGGVVLLAGGGALHYFFARRNSEDLPWPSKSEREMVNIDMEMASFRANSIADEESIPYDFGCEFDYDSDDNCAGGLASNGGMISGRG